MTGDDVTQGAIPEQSGDPREELRVLIDQIEGHLKAQRDMFGERAFVAKSTGKKNEPVAVHRLRQWRQSLQ